MRLLSELAIGGRAARLPLSDSTAQQLMAALLCDEPATRGRLLADALGSDPPLAVWALSRGMALGRDDLRSTAQLAEWLAGLSPAEWLAPDNSPNDDSPRGPGDAEIDAWADRVAAAVGVATLAARFAENAQLDAERAYLLGLVCAAPEWLRAAAGEGVAFDPMKLLPEWLAGARLAIDSAGAVAPTPPAECVAAASRVAADSTCPPSDALPFAFDAAAHQAWVDETRRRWRRASGDGQQLQALLSKLARLDQLEADFQRTLQAEKLDSLKELAYGASHEINNPLANISARAQTLLVEERDPERRRTLAAINSQAFRAHEMIADMMLFARPPRPRFEPVDLAALLAGLVAELAPWASAQHTQLVLHGPAEPLVVLADKTQLAVAIRSLCTNSLEALSTGGHLELTLGRHRAVPEQFRAGREIVQLTVADNGPGIPQSARRHIFDPFYSGREAGRGLGLGLSKCWRIVTLHGGQIDVDSTPGQGARFTITLPVGTRENSGYIDRAALYGAHLAHGFCGASRRGS